jgi:hypothetical protein
MPNSRSRNVPVLGDDNAISWLEGGRLKRIGVEIIEDVADAALQCRQKASDHNSIRESPCDFG